MKKVLKRFWKRFWGLSNTGPVTIGMVAIYLSGGTYYPAILVVFLVSFLLSIIIDREEVENGKN